jgi:hypothetical protein
MEWWFIGRLYTPLATTSNYNATAYLHTLQITTANSKSSPASIVFTSRSLETATNSGDSSASIFRSFLQDCSTELPANYQLTTGN